MYSQSSFVLDSAASLLAGDRVFVGNQPDDLFLGPQLASGARVCILGLGYGGGIRPMVAADPSVDITAVDISPEMLSAAESLHRLNFPDIAFQTRCADAATFLQPHDSYDVVVVDVYVDESHPDFISDPAFWDRAQATLAPGGVVLFNAWGLPHHLNPFAAPSPQHHLGQLLGQKWPDAPYLPCRRNSTIVLGAQALSPLTLAPNRQRLHPVDEAILLFGGVRWRHAPRLPSVVEPDDRPVPLSAPAINHEMQRRWPKLLQLLRSVCRSVGVDDDQVGSRGFYRPEIAIPVTLELARRGDPAAALLPSVAASLTFERDDSLGWFGAWMAREAVDLYAEYPSWTATWALPQALCMAANPLINRPPWYEEISSAAVTLATADEPLSPDKTGAA